MNVKVLLLPEYEDPDSFSQTHSNSELLEFIQKNESDFIKFKTRLLLEDAANDPVKKASLINDIVRTIALIPDNIERSVYIRECSRILDIDEGILYNETFKIRRNKSFEDSKKTDYIPDYRPPNNVQQKLEIHLNHEYPHEKDLIRLLLQYGNQELFFGETNNPSVLSYVINEINNDELEFSHPVYRLIFNEMQVIYANGAKFDEQQFTRHPNNEICSVVAGLLTSNYKLSIIWKKNEVLPQTEDMILKLIVPEQVMAFKSKKVLELIKDTQEEISKAQQKEDMESILLLQQKMIVLNELKMRLSKKLGERIII